MTLWMCSRSHRILKGNNGQDAVCILRLQDQNIKEGRIFLSDCCNIRVEVFYSKQVCYCPCIADSAQSDFTNLKSAGFFMSSNCRRAALSDGRRNYSTHVLLL